MLEINQQISKKSWNNFLLNEKGSFLQSFEWGEFQKSQAKEVWRLEIKEDDKTLGQAQIIKETFPLIQKALLYIPFGPIFASQVNLQKKEEILNLFLSKIKKIARAQKAIFLRIEPVFELPLLRELQTLSAFKRFQPRKTLILDLLKTKEEIFKHFTYRVRYNIKLSERKGVKIEFGDKYRPQFYTLLKETARVDRFHPFGEEHYKSLFDFSGQDFKVKLALANYREKVIAANILIFFGESVVCLHGASDRDYRALKAPTFLQWEQIKLSKDMGYKKYDFWGIDERKWPGLTFFKKSFGGEEIEYPEGSDIVFQSFWYKFYRVLRRIKQCF